MNYCTVCGNETNYLTCRSCKKKEDRYKEKEIPYDSQYMELVGLKRVQRREFRASNIAYYVPFILNAIDTLTTREERVLRLRFGIKGKLPNSNLEVKYPMTLVEVAELFRVTTERVRQIEAKALRKMRHPSRSGKFTDFFDGDFWISAPEERKGKSWLSFVEEIEIQRKLRREREMIIEAVKDSERERKAEGVLGLYYKEKMHESLKNQRDKAFENFEALSLKREERMYLWNNSPKNTSMYKIEDFIYSREQLVSGIEEVIKEYESNLKSEETKCLIYPMHEKWDLFIKIYSHHVKRATHYDERFSSVTSTLNSCYDLRNIIPSATKAFFLLCGAHNDYEALEMFKDL